MSSASLRKREREGQACSPRSGTRRGGALVLVELEDKVLAVAVLHELVQEAARLVRHHLPGERSAEQQRHRRKERAEQRTGSERRSRAHLLAAHGLTLLVHLGRRAVDDHEHAVGGRHLAEIAASARLAGGDLFARAMPTRLGLRSALAAGLPPDHLAVVRPSQGEPPGQVEQALCRRWGITAVVCRQSGGMTERLWRRIAEEQRLTLLLLRRPPSPSGVDTVVGEAAFLKWVDHG